MRALLHYSALVSPAKGSRTWPPTPHGTWWGVEHLANLLSEVGFTYRSKTNCTVQWDETEIFVFTARESLSLQVVVSVCYFHGCLHVGIDEIVEQSSNNWVGPKPIPSRELPYHRHKCNSFMIWVIRELLGTCPSLSLALGNSSHGTESEGEEA